MDQFMTFNIDEDNYKVFIKELRKRLPQSRKHGYLLVSPNSGPLSWLDVELIAGDYKIILRLDSRTLYVRGYCRIRDTLFWEFYDEESPLIPGSRSLRYSGSYAGVFSIDSVPEHVPLDYQQVLGLADAARIERHKLELGYHALRDAIFTLAVKDPSVNRELSARPLLTLIQMITEAARIELICEHIIQNWWSPQPITPRMVELENTWGTQHFTYGSHRRTLVSIEYVCLKSINGKSPVELYGSVMVEDWRGRYAVYERSSDNAESKRPGDYISLTGPSTYIYGADSFTIRVSLWDHDDEIAVGDIVWDPRDTLWEPRDIAWCPQPLASYNIPMVKDVAGACGSASVAYSVLEDALSATVTVLLINGDEESPAKVYGTIKAMIEGSPYQSWRMLFDKSEDEYVQVSCKEEFIQLTRPVFPAPVHSYITIQADLRDRDSLPPCNLIARGSVRFTPTYGTQPMKTIAGTRGVKVIININCK